MQELKGQNAQFSTWFLQAGERLQNTETIVGAMQQTLNTHQHEIHTLGSTFQATMKNVKDDLSSEMNDSFNKQLSGLEALLEKKQRQAWLSQPGSGFGSTQWPSTNARSTFSFGWLFLITAMMFSPAMAVQQQYPFARHFTTSSAVSADRELGPVDQCCSMQGCQMMLIFQLLFGLSTFSI
eukprot:s2451_g4.t1